jgi:hypothetical protein
MKFSELNFKLSEIGVRAFHEFANGYAASVVCGPWTYGGEKGLFELAVMHDGKLDYTTPLTEDVIGHLTEAQVEEFLQQIEALPAKEKAE